MEHHNDVGSPAEGLGVTGLLIPSIAAIQGVDKVGYLHALRNFDGLVVGCIIDQKELINDSRRNCCDCQLQRLRGVVGW